MISHYKSQIGFSMKVMMIHFGKDSRRPKGFYELLPKLIKTLKKRGYSFVTPDQMAGQNLAR